MKQTEVKKTPSLEYARTEKKKKGVRKRDALPAQKFPEVAPDMMSCVA